MYRWGAAFEVKMMDGIGGAVDGGSSTAHEEVVLLFLYLIFDEPYTFVGVSRAGATSRMSP